MVVSRTTGDASRGCIRGALSCKVGLAGTVGACFGTLACCTDVTVDLAFIAANGFAEVLGDGDGVVCNIDSFRQKVVCHLGSRTDDFDGGVGLSIGAVVGMFEPGG